MGSLIDYKVTFLDRGKQRTIIGLERSDGASVRLELPPMFTFDFRREATQDIVGSFVQIDAEKSPPKSARDINVIYYNKRPIYRDR